MTKADIVNAISKKTGISRADVLASVEGFIEEVMNSMNNGENVYLRGFGSFVVKKRAAKASHHIKNETTIIIPERFVPTFKPSQYFCESLRLGMEAKK